MSGRKLKNFGFSLIEIMISMFIIAITAAGATQLIVAARHAEYDAQLRKVALMLLQDMADRIQANALGGANGSSYAYNIATPSAIPVVSCTGSGNLSCTSAQLAAYDMWDWGQYIKALLPPSSAGVVTLTTPASGNIPAVYTISVSWTGSSRTSQQASVQAQVPPLS